jgi:hypothetical protein
MCTADRTNQQDALYSAINPIADKGNQREISFTSQTHKSRFTPYRMSQEERSIFWEVIVSVILSINVYVYVSYSERFPR